MGTNEEIEVFTNWIQHFDYHILQNEDDVETKFVLPLFQRLGYPENHRRGKYPLKTYNPGKAGRKPEIDQIYFTTDKSEEQNADTAILIVEAKEPQENLEDAIKQARFYGDHLNPPFLVVINGFNLRVLKRQGFRGDELVFDLTVDALRNLNTATKFYNQLNFTIVKHVKENAANTQTHEQYVRLENSLRHYPNLQEILDKGDFKPNTIEEGQRLTVIEPKVAITADLPFGFGEIVCKIEFSNITLRGLTAQLTTTKVLDQLMMGLHTPPGWNLRNFLTQIEGGGFKAELGETTVILSQTEAEDLCKCVDKICQRYKDIIVEAENNLETWDFDRSQLEEIRGFHLFSISYWLWLLIKKFTYEFDYGNGFSEWHIFDAHRISGSIRIDNLDTLTHAFIWPKFNVSAAKSNISVDLLYEIPDWILKGARAGTANSWTQAIGPRGIWTAHYTENWLRTRLIPKVLSYYSDDPQVRSFQDEKDIQIWRDNDIPLDQIIETKQLEPYVQMVSGLLRTRSIFNAKILRPYYKAFADLARHTNPNTINTGYIFGKLRLLENRQNNGRSEESRHPWDYNDCIKFLYQNVERINQIEYEQYDYLDLLTRAFASIVEEGTITCSQIELNAAKEALIPIWELSRFEERYIMNYPMFL